MTLPLEMSVATSTTRLASGRGQACTFSKYLTEGTRDTDRYAHALPSKDGLRVAARVLSNLTRALAHDSLSRSSTMCEECTAYNTNDQHKQPTLNP